MCSRISIINSSKKKKGFWSKGFPNNFFSLVPTSTATTSTSTTRCKQLLWSKGDACFLAVHFGGLVFLAFLLMRKWQRKKLEKNKKTLKSHNFWRNSRLRGGVHFFLTNHLDRLFVDLKKNSWCIIGSVIWSLDVKAWSCTPPRFGGWTDDGDGRHPTEKK